MAKKAARKVPHFLSDAVVAEIREKAAKLNKPASWFCQQYNISDQSFYKYTLGIKRPGARRKAQRPVDDDAPPRAQLLRPGSAKSMEVDKKEGWGSYAASAAANVSLAQAAVNALGAGPADASKYLSLKDQADRMSLLSKVLRDENSTLRQLEDTASACGYLLDVRLRSV